MIEGKPIVITYRPGQKYVLLALVLAAVAALLVVALTDDYFRTF